jgi:hypothetical protein
VIVGGLFIIGWAAITAPGQSKINYTEYDRLLRTYVNARGLVNYAGLKKELPALKAFVEQLGACDPHTLPHDGERLRYYPTTPGGSITRRRRSSTCRASSNGSPRTF